MAFLDTFEMIRSPLTQLQLDPFLWSSYEYLCEIGGADDLDPKSVFGVHPSAFELDTSTLQALQPLQDRSILTPSFSVAETPATGTGELILVSIAQARN